jgi:SAM-dependent methyltransferase
MHTINFTRLQLLPGLTVLDLGCGEGRHSIAVDCPSSITWVAADLSLADLRAGRAKAEEHAEFCQQHHLAPGHKSHWLNANGLHLPFADQTFDVIICSEVLEHIPDYQAMLAEIKRVAKPNAQLAISVPRRWPEQICWWLSANYAKTPGGHVRIFSAVQLQSDIQSMGYQLTKVHWAHALHSPYWWLKCLFWHQPEHFIVRAYHRLLVWDLMEKPWLTRVLERLLNPILGKSIVMYFAMTSAQTKP